MQLPRAIHLNNNEAGHVVGYMVPLVRVRQQRNTARAPPRARNAIGQPLVHVVAQQRLLHLPCDQSGCLAVGWARCASKPVEALAHEGDTNPYLVVEELQEAVALDHKRTLLMHNAVRLRLVR